MCGICGLVYGDPARPASPALLERMAGALRHRGPDDGGVWTEGNAGLGFRRLSIIDLSEAGHQPMSNEDGTVWIVFNGEIYNFAELREELRSKGHTFRSRTDTEAIVHLWEEEGERCVERLEGMFALAIWDSRARSLFLARDRMGQKPLFYADLPDRFAFASEVKALLQDPGFEVAPDLEAIHHYLAYQSVPAPLSAFQGVRKLPPAHTLLYRGGRTTLRRYWKLSYADKLPADDEKDERELEERIVERLRESVRARLVSDVALGAFLSGGLDSSLVVAMMAGLSDRPVKTFSIGFENDEYDELPYARLVAQRYGTEHHEFVVTPDARAILPKLVWHYNEPFADSSAIPTYYVSLLARQHVTVVLTGDGGDESFAGYTRYDLPGGFGSCARLLARTVQRGVGPGILDARDARGSIRRARALGCRGLLYYQRITHFHEGYQARLYGPLLRERVRGSRTVDWMLRVLGASDATDPLDALTALDLSLYLPDTLMAKIDVASMAHSLEARSPMLDHRFLELAARIPSRLKRRASEGKAVLKRAAAPHLPREVINRRKMGFGVPIDHWFRSELRELVHDTLTSARATQRGLFDARYVSSILRRHDAGEQWQYQIWNLLMLELWYAMFIDARPDWVGG